MADSIDTSGKSSIEILKGERHDMIAQAIFNILSTEIAQSTFAQIVDGLPLPSVLEDTYGGSDLEPDHPLFSHESLCPGVLQKTKELLEKFEVKNLKFDTSAHQPGSSSFKARVFELIAVAVHKIAKWLYRLDSKGHQDETIETWVPPKNKDWAWWWDHHPRGPYPTLFKHRYYFDYEKYPDGVADMVGYWAEMRVLGGVILFDRKTKPPSDAVFIHPDREAVTYRIRELTEEQKTDLIMFLLTSSSERGSPQCPLPITPNESNTHRIDPEEPISWTGVYRDIWEREPHPDELGDGRCRDVWCKGDEVNFLTFEAYQEARGRYFSRYDRYP
ncbi:hypothetical protein N8I77_005650 [Diaporthe amygdali]|uniref:Uncharacterized protein n=1 Tax=Phomopsis amygdali TaxID=1214568 RepID=A0AAD9SF00_PHOAM|nr:hypothetical protein N8I77_005650 [Diaporthe amygdali]